MTTTTRECIWCGTSHPLGQSFCSKKCCRAFDSWRKSPSEEGTHKARSDYWYELKLGAERRGYIIIWVSKIIWSGNAHDDIEYRKEALHFVKSAQKT